MADPVKHKDPVYDDDSAGKPVTRPDLRAQENQGSNTTGGQSWAASTNTDAQHGGGSSATQSSAGGARSSTGGSAGGATSGTAGRSSSYVPRDELKKGEESPDNEDDGDDDKIGQGYPYGNSNSTGKNKGRFRITRKRAAAAGFGTTGLVGLVFGFSSIASGPGQIIQLSEILQKNFSSTNQSSSNRLSKLFRYSGSARDLGETRLGTLGRQILRSTLSNLSDVGIEFQTNATGGIRSATIDPDKLSASYPELEGMSVDDQRTFLAQQFGISPDTISPDGNLLKINTSDFGIAALSALKNNALGALKDGNIITGMNERILGTYFDLPSLFHPIQRAGAAARQNLTTRAERLAAEQDRVNTEITEPVDTNTAGVRADLKGKLEVGLGSNVSRALVTTAGLCTVRSSADDAVKFNHDAIVVPAALEAVDLISLGEQVKAGQDISAEQIGGTVDGFEDSSGKSIWQGKALSSLSGERSNGPDLPSDYAQAFSDKTTANNIRSGVNLGGFAGVACSAPGIIIQGLGNLILFIANIPDGETGSFATYAAEQAASTAAVGGVVYMFQHQFTSLISDKAIVPSVLSGPLGGNLAAYGAREAANIGAVAEGGIQLSGSAVSQIATTEQQQSDQQFHSESFFARMFDVNDYRSLAGHLADETKPGLMQNLASLAGSVKTVSIGNIFSSIVSPLFSKSQAASATYDWGFPEYGIPPSLLNDPATENPYDNADQVATLLDSSNGSKYIQKAQTCFGVDINKDSGQWDVLAKTAVDPNSDDYVNANCSDLSDPNYPEWKRVILFVFDTRTMQAVDCYAGNTSTSDQSCQDIGLQQGTASSTPTTPAPSGGLPTGSAKDLALQILPYISQGKVTCTYSQASNCNDIQDTANGTSIKGNGCGVDALNPSLLGMLLKLAQMGHTFILSALCNGHHDDGPAGHAGGRAADFNTIDGTFMGPSDTTPWDSAKIAAAQKLDQDITSFMPKSTGFGQIQCHPTFSFLSGFSTFNDGCSHQHVQVET